MTTGEKAESILRDLTEPQREAVTHTEGPLLVVAAAGSGKTLLLRSWIAERDMA